MQNKSIAELRLHSRGTKEFVSDLIEPELRLAKSRFSTGYAVDDKGKDLTDHA